MTTTQRPHAELGRIGIWSIELAQAGAGEAADAAADLNAAGWRALWLPGGAGQGLWERADIVLDAAPQASVAFGVANIWGADADDATRAFAQLTARRGHRLLAGFGVSSPERAAAAGREFGTPLSAMTAFLDRIDGDAQPIPAGERILGALGPRMVALAGRRAAGIHPFLVTPESNAANRALLGDGPLIAPHQAVVLETVPSRAREIARAGIGGYLGFPTYQSNLRRLGFGDDDLAHGGSDRLIDAVVAWGGVEDIARRIEEHHAAGADHVALHVLTERRGWPGTAWHELSPLLAG
ncbi:MAG TPA: TIGR03620 family F420-dependent LLM class oxidoreductase [Gryllotalpicola sp.]